MLIKEIFLYGIFLSSAVLFGILARVWARHEKKIYKSRQYFPIFLWVLAILAAIFWTLNSMIAITLTWLFILVFVWNR